MPARLYKPFIVSVYEPFTCVIASCSMEKSECNGMPNKRLGISLNFLE